MLNPSDGVIYVIVDMQKRLFTMKGFSNDSCFNRQKGTQCSSPAQFAAVLEAVKLNLPENLIFYTDINGQIDWRDQSESDLYLHI